MTEANSASTLVNPSSVARPTSSRRRARREYTLAPSTPRNANAVTSMVSVTWSKSSDIVWGPSPQTFAENVEGSKANSMITMNSPIGTSLQIVTMRLITTAWRTPRTISAQNTHTRIDERMTASSVFPWPRPGKKVPKVVIVNTM